MKDEAQPLSDIWDVYTDSLDNAISQKLIEDTEIGQDYVWPPDLNFTDWESADVQKYVHERMVEIIDNIKAQGGLNPNLMAGYIFRSVLCGMMWQHERNGR